MIAVPTRGASATTLMSVRPCGRDAARGFPNVMLAQMFAERWKKPPPDQARVAALDDLRRRCRLSGAGAGHHRGELGPRLGRPAARRAVLCRVLSARFRQPPERASAAAILLIIIGIVMLMEYSSGYLRRWVQ
jgi:hypothetical protein